MSRAGGTEGTSTMAEPPLPEEFADLAPWLDWAVEPERARTEKREASSMVEIRAFYDAVLPRLEEMIRYLEDFCDDDMPAPARRVYLISLSLVEVANLVELYKRREAVEACDPLRYETRN